MIALRQQIISSAETFSDLACAAEQRFREAEELLTAEQFSGAIYLFGLACEMWLKLASFRLVGAGPATPVSSLFGPIKKWMKASAPWVQEESYHSLQFWVEHLIRRRATLRTSIPAEVVGQLRHHIVNRLFQDWKIEMRYRHVILEQRQAWRVYNDAAWLRKSWNVLWR